MYCLFSEIIYVSDGKRPVAPLLSLLLVAALGGCAQPVKVGPFLPVVESQMTTPAPSSWVRVVALEGTGKVKVVFDNSTGSTLLEISRENGQLLYRKVCSNTF